MSDVLENRSNSSGTLTIDTIADYVRSNPEVASRVDADTLEVREIGDGNLNQVFACKDGDGNRIIIKQALPYVRLVGPEWPMTVDRSAYEANAMIVQHQLSPNSVCEVIDFDSEAHVIVLEDLSDHDVMRTRLNAGGSYSGVFEEMGRLIAKVLVGTSWLSLGDEGFRIRAAASVNSELCLLTEELIFTEPYLKGERNSVRDSIAPAVEALQADEAWIDGAMVMKHRFLTCQESLLHGDLHTGSIFVRGTGPDPVLGTSASGDFSCKAFDAEFAFYGPVGFDIGLLWANILAAAVRSSALGDRKRAEDLTLEIERSWEAFVNEVWRLCPMRVEPGQYPDRFMVKWLESILDDSIGFAGCEAERRTIGLAKVSDVETLPEDAYPAAARVMLSVGREWLVNRGSHTLREHREYILGRLGEMNDGTN